MTTTIGRNASDKHEWNSDDKDLLYYVCKSDALARETWINKGTIFNMVCRYNHRPERTQYALTSTWSRYQKEGVFLPDPMWANGSWWQIMVDDAILSLRLVLYLICFQANLVETAKAHQANLSLGKSAGDITTEGAVHGTSSENVGVLAPNMWFPVNWESPVLLHPPSS